MSCRSEQSAPATHPSPTDCPGGEQRRGSRYNIYGSANKPFGENYRKSQVVDRDHVENQRTPVENDKMGCSESKPKVVSEDSNAMVQQKMPCAPVAAQRQNLVHSSTTGSKKLSDFEIIYGYEKPKETTYTNSPSSDSSGYSTIDIYSEVKKPEKDCKEETKVDNHTPREMLMQQIRSRREDNDDDVQKIVTVEQETVKESKTRNKSEKDEENSSVKNKSQEENNNCAVLKGDPMFVEEEYSYEPDKKTATSKIVVRSRSLINLEQVQMNQSNEEKVKRPNAMKITTKPDGTIRYGVRQGLTDSDLLDDSDDSPTQESEIKNNYVSSLKSAFDAAVIEHQAKHRFEKAEAFDGLRQYFHDNKHGLQELLTNNNVVIIEPFRHESGSGDGTDGSVQRTCRITGATIKSPTSEQTPTLVTMSNTLPRRSTKPCQNTRPGFYHPIKTNKELKDEELPDPEKVKSAREWFEQIFKSKSSCEVPSKKSTTSFFNTISSKMRITPEVKVIQDGKQTFDRKRLNKFVIDHATRDDFKRHPHKRWTDSGSLSSGVSSDLSYDQDCDNHLHEGSYSGSNQEILEEYTSEDEDGEYFYPYDDDERHPVSSEVLQKIRACGTTVTYYGGKVISRSHGQARSPMTMTIMDEIRQCGTTEGRKKFEQENEEPYLGVKFRLVKSNSCGSRLEIAGTEEEYNTKLLSPRHESFIGETIAEESGDLKEENTKNEEIENITKPEQVEGPLSLEAEEEEDKIEADRYVTTVNEPVVMTWAELKLKEARKQWHCAPEAVRIPPQDMEFETFEVLDDTKCHKAENPETGRG